MTWLRRWWQRRTARACVDAFAAGYRAGHEDGLLHARARMRPSYEQQVQLYAAWEEALFSYGIDPASQVEKRH